MRVDALANEAGFTAICLPAPERQINGVYIGDLLSWVMGRASADDAWITIMSNVNVLAVASLADVSCVLLAEGVTLPDEVLAVAQEKEINVLTTEHSAYEAAISLHRFLK